MTRTLFAILLLLAAHCQGQGMYGLETGLTYGTAYKSYITLTLGGYYSHKIGHRLYVGASACYQRYSFNYDYGRAAAGYGDALSIRQKSNYLFLAPKVSYGIGYRKYLLLGLGFGPGLLLGGSQYTNQHQPLWTTSTGPSGNDTGSINTSYNLPRLLTRYTFSLTERIPTHRYWNITLSQEFCYLPARLSKAGPDLRSSYLQFTIGIMHKYPQVLVEY